MSLWCTLLEFEILFSLEDIPRFERVGRKIAASNGNFVHIYLFIEKFDAKFVIQYEFERQNYAQDLIDFDKKFASLFSGKPQTENHADGVSHADFLKCVFSSNIRLIPCTQIYHCRIFQNFGGFTSGIGIHYADSMITQSSSQRNTKHLIVGQRLLPQLFMRAADSRPVEIQDMCPSDGRFKVLIFTGDSSQTATLQRVQAVSQRIESLLSKLSGGNVFSAFDIISISTASKAVVRYNELPSLLRSHWSK